MKMIRHEHIGVDERPKTVRQFAEQTKEVLPVPICAKDISPLVASGCYMISSAGYLDAQWASHSRLLFRPASFVKYLDLTPMNLKNGVQHRDLMRD